MEKEVILTGYISTTVFVPNSNVSVLIPRKNLTRQEKLFYALCITKNRPLFSYGRKPKGERLKKIKIPSIDEIPEWVNEINLIYFEGIKKPVINNKTPAPPKVSQLTTIDELFQIRNGIAATNLKELDEPFINSVMYIRPASQHSRTLRSYIDKTGISQENIYPVGSLFVSTNGEGSHSYSYVSTAEFVPNSDVAVLIPREKMSIELKLYYAKCITANRYLFSYGRKPKGSKLKKIKIPFFSNNEEKLAVDNFIKSLSYSSNI